MSLTIKQVLEAASEAYGAPELMRHVRMYEDGNILEAAYGHDMVCGDVWGHAIVSEILAWAYLEDDGTFAEGKADLDQVFDRMHSDIRRVKNAIDALERKAI